jgi:hypothetical protein
MSMALESPSVPGGNLGFLSVLQESGGYLGGYLVTNAWGRPLEFRLTSAVQPNRVQQILYGAALPGYVCGELIGKTLLDKTMTPVGLVITDSPLALDLRLRLELPVALWQPSGVEAPGMPVQPGVYCHERFVVDAAVIRAIVEKLGPFDLGEPFQRIREAMSEARKMGVANRLAA